MGFATSRMEIWRSRTSGYAEYTGDKGTPLSHYFHAKTTYITVSNASVSRKGSYSNGGNVDGYISLKNLS